MKRRLRPEKPALAEKPAGLDRLVLILVYVLCLLGAVLIWMVEYEIPHIPSALLGAGVGAAVFVVAWLLPELARWIIVPGALVLWAVVVLVQQEAVVQGLLYGADLIYSRFTEVFVDFQTVPPPDSAEGMAAFGVFLSLAGFALAALLAGAVLRLRSFLLALVITLPFFWFAFANTGLPPALPTLLLVCGWCGLLFRRAGRTAAAAQLRLAAMGLVGLLVVVVVVTFPAAQYKENERVLEVRGDLESIDWQSGLPDPFGLGIGSRTVAGRSATRVSLSGAGNLGLGEGTAFSVKGDIWEPIYLRGFSCSEYTGRAWRQGDIGAYEEAVGGFSPLENQWYERVDQLILAAYGMTGTDEAYETYYPAIAVRPGTSLPYSPAPYGAVEAQSGGEELPYVRDAFLSPAPGGAEYEVSYSALGTGFLWGTEEPFFPFHVAVPAPDLTAEEVQEIYGGGYDGSQNMITVVITAEEAMTDEERAYLAFIGEEYTRLPGDLDETLRQLAAREGIAPAGGYEDWHRTAYQVAGYIQNAGTYTRSPGNQPVGADFVEHFLTQSKEGYCVHFASAGAAMLRALGVPARYAEGFIIPQAAVQGYLTYGGDTDNWYDVPNANAHAWVEVWEPGVGWLPLEVTPGGADYNHPADPAPAQPGTAAGGRDPGADSGSSEAEEDDSSSSQAGEEASSSSRPEDGSSGGDGGPTGGGDKFELPGPLRTALIWIVSIAAAVVLLVLALALVRRRREKRFAGPDPNRAALEIYGYLETLGRFGVPPGEEAYALACKAKFSQHTLTGEEHALLLADARAARKRALDSLPLPRRIWFLLRGL